MALKSMTGFGRGSAAEGPIRVEVELSSVNRRQFEVRLNLPRGLAVLESRAQTMIREAISRGSVCVTVRLDSGGAGGVARLTVDLAQAEVLVRDVRRAAASLGLKDDLSARSLLALPGVIRSAEEDADTEQVWRLLQRSLRAGLARLTAMRKAEGRALEKDIQARLTGLAGHLVAIRRTAPRTVPMRRQKLRRRLADVGVRVDGDDPSFAREIALLAERGDVNEEVVRLDSHLAQTGKLMKARKPVGRQLDFLCQEMLREINTIGSKAADGQISKRVIEFKTELEILREQVQNVE